MFVNWALRSVRDSLIQVDPLAAAIAYKGQRKAMPPSAITHTPLLLHFTPFGTPALVKRAHSDLGGYCLFLLMSDEADNDRSTWRSHLK
uniref:Transposase n=1 Tax=Ascaris lumbricoides TaxID=6252 RepID=A0A0M3HUV6_ASCLU